MPPKTKTRVSPFAHPWFDNWDPDASKAQPINHWRMHQMSAVIRSKPHWQTKYKDVEIVSKWRDEINQQFPNVYIIDKLFDYVLKELEWFEQTEIEYPGLQTGGFTIECDDLIVSSKTAVDEGTRKTLINQVQELYDSFDQLDYHPGSDNKVVDLVHPSLFPLQYGTTVVKSNDGTFKIAKYSNDIAAVKGLSERNYGVSTNFQWIPSIMTNDGDGYTFSSYINNLHPVKHADLYKTLSDVFNKTLPGLAYTLDRFAGPTYYRISPDIFNNIYTKDGKESLDDHLREYYDGDEDVFEEVYGQRIENWTREIIQEYTKGPELSNFDIKDFSQLKIITKLANIELSPEDPVYPGGSWHVEGTVNEDIIATIIYYFDNENITESKLSFRTAFAEPFYEQNDDLGLSYAFGLSDGDKLVHNLGSVTSETNKCVIWPNLYQHHVDPFELSDKTKPGHRNILCFFVCDPYNDQVISTKDVPFQNEEWWDAIDESNKAHITKLSKDLPMSLEKAYKVRESLMKERSAPQVDPEEDERYGEIFSLCEH